VKHGVAKAKVEAGKKALITFPTVE
jgi:hypothetical protein